MTALPKQELTVDEFLDWSEHQPKGRYELQNGVIVTMQSERAAHTRAKASVYVALRDAIRRAGLRCHAEIDGGTVRIAGDTAFEPDALVYCGELRVGDSLVVPNPVIVVEVVSPGSMTRDLDGKLAGYFLVPSIRHYVIIDPEDGHLIHHARGEGPEIRTRIWRTGELTLDPPGPTLEVAMLFA